MEGDAKTLLRKFCLESSILGLKYFYIYPDRISRCFWAVTLISIFLLACRLTLLLYGRFEEMPTRIAIESQYELIQDIPYPAVALCSPNQITNTAVQQLKRTLVDGNRTMSVETMLPHLLGFFETTPGIKQDSLDNIQNVLHANRYTALDIIELMPQKCDDFLRYCFWRGKKQEQCQGLFHPVFTRFGMCCVFNSAYHFEHKRNRKKANFEPRKVKRGGAKEAITVITDYNSGDFLKGTLLRAGATRIMIMHWKEFPGNENTNLVYPNVESFHSIRPTYTYCSKDVATLPAFSRKCYFEDEHILPYFNEYHNTDCNMLCFTKEIEDNCHCSVNYLPHIKQSQACNVTNIKCIIDTKANLSRWNQTELCDCPRDCVSFRYQLEIDVGNLDALPDMASNPYSDVLFNKSTSLMHFAFPAFTYVKKKQETVMSLISLSSNLGGIFGLCLGCSVISVLEIFFYIYMAVKNKIQRDFGLPSL